MSRKKHQPRLYTLVNLAAWRRACRLTILHLACLCCIPEETLRAYERCQLGASIEDGECLAEMLGCPVGAASLYEPDLADEVPQRHAHASRVRMGSRKVKGVERILVYADWLEVYIKPWTSREDAPDIYQLAHRLSDAMTLSRLEAIADHAPCTVGELEAIAHALGRSPVDLITQDVWE